MINQVKAIIVSFLIFTLLLGPSQGFIVVNFEELEGGRTRIIALNTKNQKLLLYKEVNKKSEDNIDGYVLYLDRSGNVKVRKQKDYTDELNPIIIRSKKSINAYKKWETKCLNHYNIRSSEPIIEKTFKEIDEILPKKVKRKDPPSFNVNIEGDRRVSTLEFLSNERKGSLGELGMTLTMLSFGYTQRPSKYGGDNGLDGVFINFSETKLWLAQAKRETTSRSAERIMEESLNEKKIWETAKEMKRIGSDEVKETAALIRSYIKNKPKYVYKLAYRMMDKGKSQCQVNPLDIQAFPREGPKLFCAPSKEKIKSVKHILNGFERAPEDQWDLAIQSLPPISVKQAVSLVAKANGMSDKAIKNLVIGLNDKVPTQKRPRENPKKVYNRDNLYEFLGYLKSKKQNSSNIKNKIKDTYKISHPTIDSLIKNKNHAPNKNYELLWDALVAEYDKEY